MTESLPSRPTALPANIACTQKTVDAPEWQRMIEHLKVAGATFITLWGTDDRDRNHSFQIHAAFLTPAGLTVLHHPLKPEPPNQEPSYPTLSELFPASARMERATRDLLGIASTARDQRPWLRHDAWPANTYPLRREVLSPATGNLQPATSSPYPFVNVEGDGVHEIAVGPVHAGTIEPGHFRFSVVGEKVLRLEARLGYTHRGTAKLFESLPQQQAHSLAARVSGDSAVAFSWAYCAALEAITATPCPIRASRLRALALEHERLANHLGDLGALGNDAGFAFGLTQFSRLKEDLLRANQAAFAARYLLDYIVPGGVATDLPQDAYAHLIHLYRTLDREVADLRIIYDNHGGLQDRFREAGRLTLNQAEELGAIGLVARASGIAQDLRVTHPFAPYDEVATEMITEPEGDVAARVQVRFREIFESLRLCRALLANLSHTSLDAAPIAVPIPIAKPNRPGIGIGIDVSTAIDDSIGTGIGAGIGTSTGTGTGTGTGIGIIEGWRGPVLIALETGPDGTIRRCHAHDPSWQNWPLLEYAILGNIVPDFPLINKSFNLSYAGPDG